MTDTERYLTELYTEVIAAAQGMIASSPPGALVYLQPSLFGLRFLADGAPEILTYEFLDARMHLYAMRAAYKRDQLAGLVFVALGEAIFTDATEPALMTVKATPDGVLAEMREVNALRSPDSQPIALRAPRAAEMAYEDVFTDAPLPTIRKQARVRAPNITARAGRPVVAPFRRRHG